MLARAVVGVGEVFGAGDLAFAERRVAVRRRRSGRTACRSRRWRRRRPARGSCCRSRACAARLRSAPSESRPECRRHARARRQRRLCREVRLSRRASRIAHRSLHAIGRNRPDGVGAAEAVPSCAARDSATVGIVASTTVATACRCSSTSTTCYPGQYRIAFHETRQLPLAESLFGGTAVGAAGFDEAGRRSAARVLANAEGSQTGYVAYVPGLYT